MRNRILVALALAAVLPAVSVAQRTAALRDSSERLGVIVKALRDSVLKGDSLATEVASRGDLFVAASADQRANAVDALDKFARVRDRWFGNAMPSADGFQINLRVQSEVPWDSRRGALTKSDGVLILGGRPDTGNSVRVVRTIWHNAAITSLVDRYGEMMIASAPELSKWIETPPPLSMDEAERRDLAMYGFVTGMGPMQRKCVAGDLAACRFAMDIEHAPEGTAGAAFPKFMHADFLYFALDLGGAGAWQRLRDADVANAGPGPGLAAAANMPLDSLVARWRNGLLTLRPVTSVITPKTAILAITWAALFLLGALGASRWA